MNHCARSKGIVGGIFIRLPSSRSRLTTASISSASKRSLTAAIIRAPSQYDDDIGPRTSDDLTSGRVCYLRVCYLSIEGRSHNAKAIPAAEQTAQPIQNPCAVIWSARKKARPHLRLLRGTGGLVG